MTPVGAPPSPPGQGPFGNASGPAFGAQAPYGSHAPHAQAPYSLPPVTDRGGKWSPLGLGALSLVFDPAFIVTIFALIRASEDFKRVREREALGEWTVAHATVRTEAVWGSVLGLARPLLMVFAITAVIAVVGGIGATIGPAPTPAPALSQTEFEEVLERLESSNSLERAVANDHLAELALRPEQALLVLDVASRDPGRTDSLVSLAATAPSAEGVAKVRALGGRVSSFVASYYYFAASPGAEGASALLDSARGDSAIATARILSENVWPGSARARELARTSTALTVVMIDGALGEGELAEAGAAAAFALCTAGAPRELFSARAQELTSAAGRSRAHLALLGCLDDAASERVLRRRSDDPTATVALAMRGDRDAALSLAENDLFTVFSYAHANDRPELVAGIDVPDHWFAFQSSVWSQTYLGSLDSPRYLVFVDRPAGMLSLLGTYGAPQELLGREPTNTERVDPALDDDALMAEARRIADERARGLAPDYGGYP